MTTVFWSDEIAQAVSPGTHVLVIGVGGYPHLSGGDPERRLDKTGGLKQLSSPPVSAEAVAKWFLARHAGSDAQDGFHNPNAPLASLEMLVSPPWSSNEKSHRYSFPLHDDSSIEIDGATRYNIASCWLKWLERVGDNPRNIGVLYFCGHGVTGLNDYLLPEDFGNSPGNEWHDAIDITTSARAARRLVAGALYFFIDACRELKYSSFNPGAPPQALKFVDPKVDVKCFSRLLLWATGDGSMAHAEEGKKSRFTSALIQALSGYYGEPAPDGTSWVITSSGLVKAVEQIIEEQNAELSLDRQQHIEVERIASQSFHYEIHKPSTVGHVLSIEQALPHVREMLASTPGAALLPSMVQETIAERIESGSILLASIQTEVDRWSQQLSDWQARLSQEPDREAAERAIKLVEAGKLDEADALYEHLIQLAESRIVAEHNRVSSYYGKRAELLKLQAKWREAIPYLEKAVEKQKLARGGLPHTEVARCLCDLGDAWHQLAKYSKAIEYFEEALRVDKRVYGESPHRDVVRDLNKLGEARRQLSDYQESFGYFNEAFRILKEEHDQEADSCMSTTLNNLGKAWSNLGESEVALLYLEKALKIDLEVSGERPHPDVARDLNNLGTINHGLEKYREAIEYYMKALEIYEYLYEGKPNPAVASTLNNLGAAKHKLQEYKEAIKYYTQAKEIDEEIYEGKPHPALATDLNNLGVVWLKRKDIDKAISYFETAWKMDSQVYGLKPHPDVARDLDNLGKAYWDARKFEQAKECQKQAKAIRAQLSGQKLGRDHSINDPIISLQQANLKNRENGESATRNIFGAQRDDECQA